MQKYQAAIDVLAQLVFIYSKPQTRSLASTVAVLETMGRAFLLMGDCTSAQGTLEQCLAVSEMMCQEQPNRQALEAENAKVFFLLTLVYERLGQQKQVRCQRGCSICLLLSTS